MKEMQRQKDDFRYLLPPMVNDHENLDYFSRVGYVIYQVAGSYGVIAPLSCLRPLARTFIERPKSGSCWVWKELSARSQYKFCSRLFPLLYTAPPGRGPAREPPPQLPARPKWPESGHPPALPPAAAAWEAEREKKRTRSVSLGRKTPSQHLDELHRPGFPPYIA